MGRLETGQVCGTGSASRFRSIRCRLSKWIASGLKFQMPSTWPIWPNQLPAKWQPFKFATLHSGVALNALFFARWQACKCSALIQLVDIPSSKCSCLYLRTCKPIFRINMFSYNCCQIQFPSLYMSLYTSISLSLSFQVFLGFGFDRFHIDPPICFLCAISIKFLPREYGTLETCCSRVWFLGKKEHVCLSHPLKDCLIMSCSWLEYSMALGLRNFWHKNVQLFFPKIGSLLFVCNKRRSGKLGALHHWHAYLVHNVVAACQLMKWRKNCTNIKVVATANRNMRQFLGTI